MFGRKFDAIPLLNLSKSHTTYPNEQSSEDESIHIDSLVDPYAIQVESIGDMSNEMKLIHQQNESEARLNIKIEQKRQKRIYDKKVKTNRCTVIYFYNFWLLYFIGQINSQRYFSSDFQEGELFLVRNIAKDKKLPNTKRQSNYFGPFPVNSVKKSHIITRQVTDRQQTKVRYHPIHLSKKYIPREKQVDNLLNLKT